MERQEINEAELLSALTDAIQALPDAHAHISTRQISQDARRRVDAVIDVAVDGHDLELIVEAKRETFPRDVRELLWQLRNYIAHSETPGKETIPFVAARSISRGARDLLRDERVGFYDLGGSLFIPSRALYVLIDRPPPKRSRRVLSIFEGQKARTIITLFAYRGEWIGVTELAQRAEVSPSTASATLSEMEQHDWVDVEGTGPAKVRRLRHAGALLDEWSAYLADQKAPKISRYYVPSENADDLCRKLDHACRSNDLLYAITGEAAAQRYAPYLSAISQVRCRVAPGQLRDRVLEQMDARSVSEGWNLALVETKRRSDIIVGDEIGDLMVAPPLQVYLDLLQGSGRAKEMAAHLRAEKLDA
jgi:hypothetical protein